MYLLVVYDVDTTDVEGTRRLRQVAKICEGYGQRVQKSVFEVSCTPAEQVELAHRLTTVMHQATDSLRIYNLPGSVGSGVSIFGVQRELPDESAWTL